MIITCPDCATRYDVDDERFSPNGRSVRCSSCSESWFVPAPELIDVEPLGAPLEEGKSSRRQDYRDAEVETRHKPKRSAEKSREGGPIRVGFTEERDDERDSGSRHGWREKEQRSHRYADDDGRGDGRSDDRDRGNGRDRDTRQADSRRYRDEEDELPSRKAAKRPVKSARADYDDDDEDDSLFEPRGAGKDRDNARDYRDDKDEDESADARHRSDEEDDRDEKTDKGWRKGRQFIVEDDGDEEDVERRPFFARKRKDKQDEREASSGARESLRFADEDDVVDALDEDDRGYDDDDEIVDADFEDVDADGARQRGFGRRVREGRRRATALARMEDVRPLNPEALDEEFFAALRVTPRELERAIRKARRRAESREKNRLTPLRVFGWTAWLAAVAGACYAIVIYRDDIVKMAPRTADAYAVIGIEANPYGLAIDNVRHRLAMSTGGPTIEITGHLRNETEDAVDAPLMQAEALGARGELLARWTFTPSQPEVAQGDIVEFVTRAPAPDGVTEVALSFAPAKSVLDSLLPLDK